MKYGQWLRQVCAALLLFLPISVEAEETQSTMPPAQPRLVRLAIVNGDSADSASADLLAVKLSHTDDVTLLERAQISKILNEQAISTGNASDCLKLGEVLGADGLVIMNRISLGTNSQGYLSVRLIAVKPGAVLQEHLYPLPIADSTDWAGRIAAKFQKSFPGLRVPLKSSIPLSIVNLRSSANSPQGREQEREVKRLLIERMAGEPGIFVLEREHLREATAEKEFKMETEKTAFWTGRYLLDGVLDKDEFNPEKITVNARLLSPQGATLSQIDLSGPRKDLPVFVESLTAKLLEGLHKAPGTNAWASSAEADRFLEEARWEHSWGMFREAQESVESAWALGKHSKECAIFLIENGMRDPSYLFLGFNAIFPMEPYALDRHEFKFSPELPDVEGLGGVQQLLDFYCNNTPEMLANRSPTNTDWLRVGLQLLYGTTAALGQFYDCAEARQGHEEALGELRSSSRQIAKLLEVNDPSGKIRVGGQITLRDLKWTEGGYWFDRPEDALKMQRQLLETDWHPFNPPWAVGWTWEDRKRVPGLVKSFVQDAVLSTNPALHLEGLYLSLARAPVDEFGAFKEVENNLLSALWEQRNAVFRKTQPDISFQRPFGKGVYEMRTISTLFSRTEATLMIKRRAKDDPGFFEDELFSDFKTRLRRDFFKHPSDYDNTVLYQLFDARAPLYTDAEVAEFVPLAKEYERNPSTPQPRRLMMDQFLKALESHSSKPPTRGPETPPDSTGPLISSQPNPVSTNQILEIVQFKRLVLPQASPDLAPVIQSGIYREHKLWFQVRYQHIYENGRFLDFEAPPLFLEVDPDTGAQRVIDFPARLGYPDPGQGNMGLLRRSRCFEVTRDSLYVSVQNRIQRYRLKEAVWEELPVPMEAGGTISACHGSLYVNTASSILKVDPESKETKILASTRRRPTVNFMDELPGYSGVYPWPEENVIRVTTSREMFEFLPATGTWKKSSTAFRVADPDKYRPKSPPFSIWSNVHFEKDGQIINPIPRRSSGEAVSAESLPDEIVFRCGSAQSAVVADPLQPGYWLVPLTKLESISASSKP
jgi:hypothetical protein